MIKTTTYEYSDLESGVCTSCNERSNEIVVDDGRCVDCVEADNFYEETMKGL